LVLKDVKYQDMKWNIDTYARGKALVEIHESFIQHETSAMILELIESGCNNMELPKNETLFTRNFVLTSLSTVAIFTSFYFLLVTLPRYILDELHGSESEIGLIIGVFTISAVLLRPFIGQEVDRRGRKVVLIAGLIVFFLSMLFYNYTRSVEELLMLRVLQGIGWGAATTAATTLIADVAPPNRRGEAMGIFGMSANVAMAVGPTLSIVLLESSSYTTLFITSSAIALISLLLALPISETAVVHPETPLFSREAFFPSAIMFTISLTYGSIVSFMPLFATKQGITNPGIFFTVFAITLILVKSAGWQDFGYQRKEVRYSPGYDNNCLWPLGSFICRFSHCFYSSSISLWPGFWIIPSNDDGPSCRQCYSTGSRSCYGHFYCIL